METAEQLKEIVRQKYAAVATQPTHAGVSVGPADANASCRPGLDGPTSCCGPSSPGLSNEVPINMAVGYDNVNGYVVEADLGLGCGLPTQFAQIKPGDVVVDLGSGAGNDCFVARAETGETGRVIGLDMTPAMIDRARKNAKTRGFTNVEFVYGDIEDMPLPENLADVVVSNCVMNLVPDKQKAFTETYRILEPGGHFSISDIVLEGDLPAGILKDAELYAGCVSGAIQKDVYLQMVQDAGFTHIIVQKECEIILPDALLQNYLTADEIAEYRAQDKGLPADRRPGRGIYSITVYAEKPTTTQTTIAQSASCCGPTCCN